jgi:hypothetical protein
MVRGPPGQVSAVVDVSVPGAGGFPTEVVAEVLACGCGSTNFTYRGDLTDETRVVTPRRRLTCQEKQFIGRFASAGLEQDARRYRASWLRESPRQEHFATNSVAVSEFLLDNQDPRATERHGAAQGGPSDAATDPFGRATAIRNECSPKRPTPSLPHGSRLLERRSVCTTPPFSWTGSAI